MACSELAAVIFWPSTRFRSRGRDRLTGLLLLALRDDAFRGLGGDATAHRRQLDGRDIAAVAVRRQLDVDLGAEVAEQPAGSGGVADVVTSADAIAGIEVGDRLAAGTLGARTLAVAVARPRSLRRPGSILRSRSSDGHSPGRARAQCASQAVAQAGILVQVPILWSAARSTSSLGAAVTIDQPRVAPPEAGFTHTSPMDGMTTTPNWMTGRRSWRCRQAPAPRSRSRTSRSAGDERQRLGLQEQLAAGALSACRPSPVRPGIGRRRSVCGRRRVGRRGAIRRAGRWCGVPSRGGVVGTSVLVGHRRIGQRPRIGGRRRIGLGHGVGRRRGEDHRAGRRSRKPWHAASTSFGSTVPSLFWSAAGQDGAGRPLPRFTQACRLAMLTRPSPSQSPTHTAVACDAPSSATASASSAGRHSGSRESPQVVIRMSSFVPFTES